MNDKDKVKKTLELMADQIMRTDKAIAELVDMKRDADKLGVPGVAARLQRIVDLLEGKRESIKLG